MPTGIYPHKKGWKHSEETKHKIGLANSIALKGRKFTKEWRKHLSESGKGRKQSEECKQKISKRMKGAKHPNWKGGKTSSNRDGYILIKKPDHPFCNIQDYIYEHRLIMEQMLGRYLTKNEIVHHKNGIRDDNRPENLILMIKGKNWHPCLCPKCGFDFLIK